MPHDRLRKGAEADTARNSRAGPDRPALAVALGVVAQLGQEVVDHGQVVVTGNPTPLLPGPSVVDSFYVRTANGTKVTDSFHRAEIQRAVLHAVGSPS